MSNYVITTIDPDYFSETHTIGATSAQSSAVITGSGTIRISISGTHAHINERNIHKKRLDNLIHNSSTYESYEYLRMMQNI